MTNPDPHPIVLLELTRACDLHCRNCPSGADERPGPNELTTYESYKTIDQIVALQLRELVITGGDPLERDDVDQIVDYARRRGLDPALVVSPTTRLTSDAVARLARHGLTRIVISIDGSAPEIHQAGHGVVGTFATSLLAMQWAQNAGLAIEVNTLVSRRNADDLDAIVDLIRPWHPERWNVHFIVPIGGSTHVEMLTAAEVERVFATLAGIRDRERFAVRVVEAPHFRRFLLQRSLSERLHDAKWLDFTGCDATSDSARDLLDAATDGAQRFLYISHAGDVRASEFLPQSAGNLRYRPLGAIYRAADLFVALRDPANLKGKCGRCEFRHLCGGSRARAWAMTGDLFATDPLCAYEPGSQPMEGVYSRPPLPA
jgi:radical SAM protein with 4Fe4S-binding SPASM domain